MVVPGLVVGLALAGAGCGEPSDSEFRTEVDGICKRASVEVDKVPVPKADDLAGNAQYAAQVLPIVRRTHKQLKAVDAPGNRKSGYKTYVGAIDRFSRLLERRRLAARAGDRKIYGALVEQQNTVLQESKAQAALLGFQQCSK